MLGWPAASPAYDANKDASRAFNLDTAQSILKEAGVTGPINQEFGYPTGNQPYADFAQAYQSDLAKVGINITLKPVDIAVLRDAMNNGSLQGLRAIDAVLSLSRPWIIHYEESLYQPDGERLRSVRQPSVQCDCRQDPDRARPDETDGTLWPVQRHASGRGLYLPGWLQREPADHEVKHQGCEPAADWNRWRLELG